MDKKPRKKFPHKFDSNPVRIAKALKKERERLYDLFINLLEERAKQWDRVKDADWQHRMVAYELRFIAYRLAVICSRELYKKPSENDIVRTKYTSGE